MCILLLADLTSADRNTLTDNQQTILGNREWMSARQHDREILQPEVLL